MRSPEPGFERRQPAAPHLTVVRSPGQTRRRGAVLGTAAAICLAEGVTVGVDPRLGALVYGLSVVVLANVAVLTKGDERRRRFLAAAALVPLSRLIAFAVPFAGSQVAVRAAVVTPLLAVTVLLVGRALGTTARDLGLVAGTAWRFQLLAIAACIPIGDAIAVSLGPGRRLIEATPAGALAAVALTALAFAEELLFRGLLLSLACAAAGRLGEAVVAAIWAVMFLGSGSPFVVVLALVAGLVLGQARLRSGSLLASWLAHAVLNLLVYAVPATVVLRVR